MPRIRQSEKMALDGPQGATALQDRLEDKLTQETQEEQLVQRVGDTRSQGHKIHKEPVQVEETLLPKVAWRAKEVRIVMCPWI